MSETIQLLAWNRRVAKAINGMELSRVRIVSRIVSGKLLKSDPPVLWAEVNTNLHGLTHKVTWIFIAVLRKFICGSMRCPMSN